MKKHFWSLLTVFFFCGSALHAQLVGQIISEKDGNPISGAVIIDSTHQEHRYTNENGYFYLGSNALSSTLWIYAVGHFPMRLIPNMSGEPQVYELKTADVWLLDTTVNKAISAGDLISSAYRLDLEFARNMVMLASVNDPQKSLQFLPGVQAGLEGSGGLIVRGGGTDQHLFQIDGVPVYNSTHTFGFFSVFNEDAIRGMEFYKGVYSAVDGGRAGALVKTQPKQGSNKKWTGKYSIDLLTMRLTFGGKLDRLGKSTLNVALRRSWWDAFLPKSDEISLGYYFHDYQAYFKHQINQRQWVSASLYHGRDKLYINLNDNSTDSTGRTIKINYGYELLWQNLIGSLKYVNELSNVKTWYNQIGFSRYTYRINEGISISVRTDTSFSSGDLAYSYKTRLNHLFAKSWFEDRQGAGIFRYGGELGLYQFNPGELSIEQKSRGSLVLDTVIGNVNRSNSAEIVAFGEYEKILTGGGKIIVGLRNSVFTNDNQVFIMPDPRFQWFRNMERNKTLHFSAGINHQAVLQLTNVNSGLPGDFWFPADKDIKPMRSYHAALGLNQAWQKGWLLSGEIYYRYLDRAIDFAESRVPDIDEKYWIKTIRQGKGWNYGLEVKLVKSTGLLRTTFAYTWSKADRQIEGINFGEKYPFRWDRRHMFTMIGEYRFSEALTLNYNFVFMTGNAVTLPRAKYLSADGKVIYDYGSKNNYRMPTYHRLDVGFRKRINAYSKFAKPSYWGIQVYNVYGRFNPIYMELGTNTQGETVLNGVSWFNFFPSAFYSLEF